MTCFRASSAPWARPTSVAISSTATARRIIGNLRSRNQPAGDGNDAVCLDPQLVWLQRIHRCPLHFRNIGSGDRFASVPTRGEVQDRVMKPDTSGFVAADRID